jgi:hypothetical protein
MKLNRQNESKAQGRNPTDMWEILSPVLCCILEEAIEKWRERESKQLCEIEDITWKQTLEKPEGLKNKELPIATIILALGQRFQKLAS